MRAILDTTVLVSAAAFGGLPRRVLEAAGTGFELLLSNEILDELEVVLARPKFTEKVPAFTEEDRRSFIEMLIRLGPIIRELPPVPVFVPDPKDTHLLALAMATAADYLVTGDKPLLEVGTYEGTRVITTRAFLDLLEDARPWGQEA